MKFGIFYEHQLPRPWTPNDEYELLQNSLTEIELADRLGYDYAWEVEHHFLEEYSHSSAPEVFLAAASQRTKRIRLGHGIIQLTTNHPARVAERVSTLDLVSRGRVELGLGEASSVTELHPFGRRFRDKREVWEDAVRALIPMFGDGGVEYHGPTSISRAQRPAEAAAEASPAALGRVLPARHDRGSRALGNGSARLPVRERRRQAGRNTHEDICSSLELFASEVMPEFVDRHGEHEQWKRSVLAGEIILEEIDTSPEHMPRPERRPIS